jgi:hypothetical protein
MRVTTAQLPEAADSDDKVFTTPNAVIMLDGASAFLPVPVTAGAYAECLGGHLRDGLTEQPARDLKELLAAAIDDCAAELSLTPGKSPSSTVTIVRQEHDALDILVLGDNFVTLPEETITDDRTDQLNLAARRTYRDRLAAGSGYDDEHRTTLRELQIEQAKWRNREGGYWIAEAEPTAAEHALVYRRSITTAPWAVLATDGAYNTMQHLAITQWPVIAQAGSAQLAAIVHRCQRWETDTDPAGRRFPRAKVHDDKTLVAVRVGSGLLPHHRTS